MEQVISAFLKEGLFAGLCVLLLFWFLKEAKEREKNNRSAYANWTEELEDVKDMVKITHGKLDQVEQKIDSNTIDLSEIRTSLRVLETFLARDRR